MLLLLQYNLFFIIGLYTLSVRIHRISHIYIYIQQYTVATGNFVIPPTSLNGSYKALLKLTMLDLGSRGEEVARVLGLPEVGQTTVVVV